MNKYIKLVIAVLMIGGGIFLFTEREYAWGSILIFLSIIPILLFFRNEYILLAFWQMRKQNIEGAKNWLNKIRLQKKDKFNKQYLVGDKPLTPIKSLVSLSSSKLKKLVKFKFLNKAKRLDKQLEINELNNLRRLPHLEKSTKYFNIRYPDNSLLLINKRTLFFCKE